jgi:site-specific recombinase XerD
VAGCTEATLRCYTFWLGRLLAGVSILTPLAVRGFFARLQERGLSLSRQHQAYRVLKTFFRWSVEVGILNNSPLRGFVMRTPKTLPDVPTEDELRASPTGRHRRCGDPAPRVVVVEDFGQELPAPTGPLLNTADR